MINNLTIPKIISLVTPCYNEELNVKELYNQTKLIFESLVQYRYEHIFIDNASEDSTVQILKSIAQKDKNVKIIINARNFGHIRSPHHGLLQAQGDAVVFLVADLQSPPSMIPKFIEQWEKGWRIVVGVKPTSKENFLMAHIRRLYYKFINRISDVKQIKNFMGFGLYDRTVIEELRKMDDPYPYFRGMLSEIGFPIFQIPYHQPPRHQGKTKNNFYTLYDMAMLAITGYSKLPLRIATIIGFFLSLISLFMAIAFIILKILFWDQFPIGIAPILISEFFFFSILLFFIGLLGEYLLSIHTQVLKRPLVIEKERINF